MTLAEKYGIQVVNEIQEINLNQNPYKFEGTFSELYGLVASGRLKVVKQDGILVGGSISGYDTIEDDNLAYTAFMKAYVGKPIIEYVNLAVQLVEANLIPSKIEEDPLRVTVLNGLVTLDLYGNEVDSIDATDETNTEVEGGYLFHGVKYQLVKNPLNGRPNLARVDGEEIPNRKQVAKNILVENGYTYEELANLGTNTLERMLKDIFNN